MFSVKAVMDESYLQRQGTLSRRTFLKLSVGALLLLAGCDVGRGAPRIGLALGGGGAKGLAHIPMLTVLDEMGVRPYRIAGTSIGAIIGALYASGLSGAEIRALVEQFLIKKYPEVQTLISLPKSWRWLDFVDPEIDRGGLLNSSDFIKFLGEILPVKSFNKLKVSLTVVAAEFWSGKQVVLDSGDILPALEASMALPGIFLPVELNGRKLVDGGVVNPLPYDLLMEECDLVIAIDVSGSRFNESENGPSFIGVLFHSFHTMGQNLVAERLKQQRPHIYIRPDIRDVRTLEFYKAKQVFDQSQPAARQLARILKSRLS